MAGMTQKELKKSYFHCGPIVVTTRNKIRKCSY